MVATRHRSNIVIALLLVSTAFVTARPAGQAPEAAAMLRAARDGIGGDARVRSVKTLRLTGTLFATQTVSGGYTHDTEDPLELRFAFPDRFLEVTARALGPMIVETRRGFVADRTISSRNGEPTTPRGEATYVRKKAAELLLVLLARTEPWGSLTLAPAAASALTVKGLDGYAARLEFSPSTGRLERLIYSERRQVRPRNTILRKGQSQPTSPARGVAGSGGAGADLPAIDIAITVADHRSVDGIVLPHRITTTALASGMLLWELRFETITVNPPMTEADFES